MGQCQSLWRKTYLRNFIVSHTNATWYLRYLNLITHISSKVTNILQGHELTWSATILISDNLTFTYKD